MVTEARARGALIRKTSKDTSAKGNDKLNLLLRKSFVVTSDIVAHCCAQVLVGGERLCRQSLAAIFLSHLPAERK